MTNFFMQMTANVWHKMQSEMKDTEMTDCSTDVKLSAPADLEVGMIFFG